MKRFALVISLVACVVASAWAADVVVERYKAGPDVPGNPGYDNTQELSWDSGFGRWWIAYYTGAGTYAGNDFDISTVKTYSGLKTFRLQSGPTWPNTGWDGGRIAVFSFAGGVPGSMLWPTSGTPKFVMPSGPQGWKDFDVSWVLPGVKKFVAAWEQFYNHPACDPITIDNNPVFLGHSWLYYQGQWSPWESANIAPYRNVMIRMIVDNEQNPAVSPSSIGRVKALYF
jgi:hypothetical protein